MPSFLERGSLEAELRAVKKLLDESRQLDDPTGEMQFQSRLEGLEEELRLLDEEPGASAGIGLYFGGRPVLGSRGIAADFAGSVLEHFQNVVSRCHVAKEVGNFGQRGPIPQRASGALMVTSVLRGSFGFMLEELNNQSEIFSSPLKATVEEVVGILQKLSAENDDEFDGIVGDLEPRTLQALGQFFSTLDSSGSTVRLVRSSGDVTLDEAAVRRGKLRTDLTEIAETTTEVDAVLLGILPAHRKFEMTLLNGPSIYGSVSDEAAKQHEQLVANGKSPERQVWRVELRKRTVLHKNRAPREVYRLIRFVGLPSGTLEDRFGESGMLPEAGGSNKKGQ